MSPEKVYILRFLLILPLSRKQSDIVIKKLEAGGGRESKLSSI